MRYTQPEACLTGSITTSVVSLTDFGFDEDMVGRSRAAYIYVHTNKVLVKWAQDHPRVSPTSETTYQNARPLKDEAAPVPAALDGHGINTETERVILGRQALKNLRLVAESAASTVTITLEG